MAPVTKKIWFALFAILIGVALAGGIVWALALVADPVQSADYKMNQAIIDAYLKTEKGKWLECPEHPGGGFTYLGKCETYLRRAEIPKQKPAGVPQRDIMLGDSHVHGICDACENVTALLGKEHAPNQVVNGGFSGWSPLDALIYYRTMLAGYDFDTVVHVLYVGNDLSDLFRPGSDQLKRDGAGWKEVRLTANPAPSRLEALEWRFGLLDGKLSESRRRAFLCADVRAYHPGLIDQMFFQAIYFKDRPQDLEEGFAGLEFVERSLRDLAVSRKARFILVVLPTKKMVEPETIADLTAYGTKELELTSDTVNLDETVHARVLAMAKADGIECVDLLPALKAEHQRSPSTPLFWHTDFHISIYGMKVAAAVLGPVLFGKAK